MIRQSYTPLEDLDELVLRCRDKTAKDYISEAITCYRAGAFRSSISATYLAVVYDIVRKLRELALSGDSQANLAVEKFDELRRINDIASLLKFERELIEFACEKIELYSVTESIDLIRIKEDRNRCSHPTLNMDGEVFSPSGSLARTHIANSVNHLLCRPPSQGKSAIEALLKDLESELFPTSNDAIRDFFENSPLVNGRVALIRNFLVVAFKKLLLENTAGKSFNNYVGAISFLEKNRHDQYINFLTDDFPKISDRVADENISRFIRLLSKKDDIWAYLSPLNSSKIKDYVTSLKGGNLWDIETALRVTQLRSSALRRIGCLTFKEFDNHIVIFQADELYKRALEIYARSSSYAEANSYISLFTDCFWGDSSEVVFDLIDIASKNTQVSESHEYKDFVARSKANPKIDQDRLEIALS